MRRNRRLGDGETADSNTSLMDILGNSLGGVLFLLILMMVIMVLLPKGMTMLRPLAVLPHGEDTADLPPAIIGEPYTYTFADEGGHEYVSHELVDGEFPPGLDWHLERHGWAGLTEGMPGFSTRDGIRGTPVGPPGVHEFTIRARSTKPENEQELEKWETDPGYAKYKVSEPRRFRIAVVAPPAKRIDTVEPVRIVTPPEVPAVHIGGDGACSFRLEAEGGIQPFTWSLGAAETRAAHPAGVSVDPSGVVTLRADEPKTFSFTVAVDSAPPTLGTLPESATRAVRTISVPVLPPVQPLAILTPDPLPPATDGESYALALSAAGGSGDYVWEILDAPDAEPAPRWVWLEKGVVRADPTTEHIRKEPYVFAVAVRDGLTRPDPVVKTTRLLVKARALVTDDPNDPAAKVRIVTKEELPDAVAEQDYRVMLAAQGGRPPYHWQVGGFQFRKNEDEEFGEQKSWDHDAGEMGLRLDDDGWFSGKPDRYGTARILLGVWDSNPDGSLRGGEKPGAAKWVALSIDPPIEMHEAFEEMRIVTPSALPDAVAGERYAFAFSAVGGLPPYRWSIADKPPPGMEMEHAASGFFCGTPEETGKHMFTVVLADRRGEAAAEKLVAGLEVLPPPARPRIVTAGLPPACAGADYEAAVLVEGGAPPLRWSVVDGRPPDGVRLDAETGVLSGKIDAPSDEPAEFVVRVVDGADRESQRAFTLEAKRVIDPTPLSIATDHVLPTGVAGRAWSLQLAVTGGVPPYVWSEGIPFPSDDTLRLTPHGRLESSALPESETLELAATVTDASGAEASRRFRLTVVSEAEAPPEPPQKLSIVTIKPLPPAVVGKPYALALAATGGDGRLSWSLDGKLPQGLSFDAKRGVVKGTATRKAADAPAAVLTATVRDGQTPPDTDTTKLTLSVMLAKTAQEEKEQGLSAWLKYLGFLLIYLGYSVAIRINQSMENSRHSQVGGVEVHGTWPNISFYFTSEAARDEWNSILAQHKSMKWIIRIVTGIVIIWFCYYVGLLG